MEAQSPLRIGNGQGFWGDSPLAPARLVSQQPNLDYLTLDYLAEISLSIMAIQQEKDSTMGYAADFLDVIRSLIPLWKSGIKTKVIANAGGLNPKACATACQQILDKENCSKVIGIVSGDSVLQPGDPFVSANAYLGAEPIVEALQKGAEIVITGRVADPSLTVAPCLFHYNWNLDDLDKLAQATVAGHLIECGAQVTGGIATHWLDIPNHDRIGFPFVEVHSDGSFVITKPEGTGGEVSLRTVKEQLLYEIGDPDNYLSPDVTVSFLNLQLEEIAPNRIQITGAKGKPSPSTYKVSATYRDGYRTEGLLTIVGPNAIEKGKECAKALLKRFNLQRTHVECLGSGALAPNILQPPKNLSECLLRISVADPDREKVQAFAKEIASLVTCGPQGVTGYTSGRPKVRPILGYLPTTIDKSAVTPYVEVLL